MNKLWYMHMFMASTGVTVPLCACVYLKSIEQQETPYKQVEDENK